MPHPTRIVLDTNVLVSGLLKRNNPPGRILELILAGQVIPVLDACILAEYTLVLARPRLQISPAQARQTLLLFTIAGESIASQQLTPSPEQILDPSDLPFAEVAVTASVDALVTGNLRHFTFLAQYGVLSCTPAEFLERFVGLLR